MLYLLVAVALAAGLAWLLASVRRNFEVRR
jgi:hypothetical protein